MRAEWIFVGAGLAFVACVKNDDRASTTTTTSATVRRSHTVDNAGFVDNAGHTTDELAPTEMSGERATELGGRAPAASPTTARARTAAPASAPVEGNAAAHEAAYDDRGERIGRAICDRETFCGRVGQGRTWASQEACTVQFGATGRAYLEGSTCVNGVDETQLGTCLASIRHLSCSGEQQTLQSLPACRSLCNP